MKKIILENIFFTYKSGKKVFQNFSLNLARENSQGTVTAIMGASGAGKSTLIKMLLGIEKPQSGTITISPTKSIISYVPQEPVLFEHLSVENNAKYFQFAGAYKNRFNETLYKKLVNSLGLEEVMLTAKSVNEISGGQRQRLSLLRALSIEPDFLLLDEPCNGLDAEVKRAFLNQLRSITESLGLYVLYITHHKLEAELIADNVVYLVKDKQESVVNKVVAAPTSEFMNTPPVLDAVSVFKFPDYKLLPIKVLSDNDFQIVEAQKATCFCLVEDANIKINLHSRHSFKLISKSPIFSIIQHGESETEWFIRSPLISTQNVGDNIKIDFINLTKFYSLEGDLLNVDNIHKILA